MEAYEIALTVVPTLGFILGLTLGLWIYRRHKKRKERREAEE